MKRSPAILSMVAILLVANTSRAACLNKFLNRSEGTRQVVTLLTGKLTFQEAQELSAAIDAKKTTPLSWVDDRGKEISHQFGLLKIVRPMPVACDGKASGVVMIVTFPTTTPPTQRMMIKIDENRTIQFIENN